MNKVVAIDLGSNTFRALLYDCSANQIVASYEKTVRLAQNLSNTGYISDEAVERVVTAATTMSPSFKDLPTKAVTTQAMRMAKNNHTVLQQLKAKTAITFEIIDGKTEGRLTCQAVQNRLKLLEVKNDSFVVVDIGGGSTEVIFYSKYDIEVHSFNIGIVTATENGFESLDSEFEKVKDFCKGRDFDIFISTAGTPTTVAALKKGLNYHTYDARVINGMQLGIDDLDSALQTLLTANKAKREELVGTLRDDLIITGITIYKKFFEILQVQSSMVIDDGLREGVALKVCKEKQCSH